MTPFFKMRYNLRIWQSEDYILFHYVDNSFTGVDFWSSPSHNRSEVTFLVGPSQTNHVKKYLKKHHFKAKVLTSFCIALTTLRFWYNTFSDNFQELPGWNWKEIKDKYFFKNIDMLTILVHCLMFRENKENSFCVRRTNKIKHLMKRQSIWDDFFDTLTSFSSSSSSHRRPRKINQDSLTVNEFRENRCKF